MTADELRREIALMLKFGRGDRVAQLRDELAALETTEAPAASETTAAPRAVRRKGR